MAQFLLLFLISVHAFVVLAMANEKARTMVEHNVASFSNPPALSPSNGGQLDIEKAPVIRKLGRHYPKMVDSFSPRSSSPAEAPNVQSVEEISASKNEEYGNVKGQEVHLKVNHHSMDKSIAGGGVILGGLATTFLVAVFCYIRATGRRNVEINA